MKYDEVAIDKIDIDLHARGARRYRFTDRCQGVFRGMSHRATVTYA
jgi:hypothetical protein